MAAWDIAVHDQGQSDATSGATIGGLTFGSMGSGIHTTTSGSGLSLPPWLLPAALALAVLLLLKRKGR